MDAAESAGAAREQGGVTGQRGEEGEGEGTLALQDALWSAEARRGGSGRPVAAGYDIGHRRLPTLLLGGLNLAPLQLQQPVKVPFQRAHRPGPRGPLALHVVEDRQLTEAPGVKRWREEVWEVKTAVAASSGPVAERGAVFSLDGLWPQLELRRNPAGR